MLMVHFHASILGKILFILLDVDLRHAGLSFYSIKNSTMPQNLNRAAVIWRYHRQWESSGTPQAVGHKQSNYLLRKPLV
jgi:hypothetical protein